MKNFWNWRTRIGNVTIWWPAPIIIVGCWISMFIIYAVTHS